MKSKLTVNWIESFIWERTCENSCKDLDVFLMQLGYVSGKNQIVSHWCREHNPEHWWARFSVLTCLFFFFFEVWGVTYLLTDSLVFCCCFFRDFSHDFIMLPPDCIYYVYCLVCSTFIAKHCIQPWLTLLALKSLQLLPKLDIMTMWYSKSMMGDSTSYCSGTKEAE